MVDFFGIGAELTTDLETFEVFGVDLAGDTPAGFFLAVVLFLLVAFSFVRAADVLRDLVLRPVTARIFPMDLAFAPPSRGFFLFVASFLFAGFCFFKAFK